MNMNGAQEVGPQVEIERVVSCFEMTNDSPIDDDIVPLCRALNQIDGVTTGFSCSGHESTDGYVSFTCKNNESIDLIARKITPSWLTTDTKHGPVDIIYVRLNVELCQNQLVYCIRWGGMSADYQKQARKNLIDALCS